MSGRPRDVGFDAGALDGVFDLQQRSLVAADVISLASTVPTSSISSSTNVPLAMPD